MRFLRTARAFRYPDGGSLRSVALHTEIDRGAWFVREADEAYRLDGEGVAAYLDLDGLRQALRTTRLDAVWVGWGFVAEDPAFAALCEEMGISYIGPSAQAMRRLGDKISAKQLAEAVGVAVAPWSGGAVRGLAEASLVAARIGFPLMIKAAAGGGGRGVRAVDQPAELPEALAAAGREAAAAFGDATLFLERKLPAARHVEVQVAADGEGGIWTLGVRDCSVQRRNQKLLEESSSTALSRDQAGRLEEAAVRLCRAADYRNLGTVEFLISAEDGSAVFMEMNTRLQVEHTVTEETVGLDLVALQLELAAGRRLTGSPPERRGHAIEVRLNAEDPGQGFAPSPGRVAWFKPPLGPGIRVDSGVSEGDEIPPVFDSMIAKVIAVGGDRAEAMRRLAGALRTTEVVIEGGASNRALLAAIVDHPTFVSGAVTTAWLNDALTRRELGPSEGADLAIVQVAVEAYEADWLEERRHFYSTARRGRPEVRRGVGERVNLSLEGQTYDCVVRKIGLHRFVVEVDGRAVDVHSEATGPYRRRVEALGRAVTVMVHADGPAIVVEAGAQVWRFRRGDAGLVRTSAPGVVIAIQVEPGQTVAVGDPLVVVEAMKVETAIQAPFGAKVLDVFVDRNEQVDAGDPLVRLDTASSVEGEETDRARLFADDAGSESSTSAAPIEPVDVLVQQLLGYDVSPVDLDAASAVLASGGSAAGRSAGRAGSTEDRLLDIFAEISALSLAPDDVTAFDAVRGPSRQDHLLRLLRSLDRAEPEQLVPPDVLATVDRLLTHYRATRSSARTELEDALARLYRGQLALESAVGPVLSVLEHRFTALPAHRSAGDRSAGDPSVALLARLVEATDGLFPAVAEYARMVLDRAVAEPELEAADDAAVRSVEAAASAVESGGPPARPGLVDELSRSTLPLTGALLDCVARSPGGPAASVALEVLVRRTYRRLGPGAVTITSSPAGPVAWSPGTGAVDPVDGPVVAAAVGSDRRSALAAVDVALAGETGPVAVELYVPGVPRDPELLDAVAGWAGSSTHPPLSTVTVTWPGGPSGQRLRVLEAVRGGGWAESELLRDLHPTTAGRLELWRLSDNFELSRRPSATGIYLFRARAKDNRRDERLFALAEVREGEPSGPGQPFDPSGLQRVFLQAAGSLRREVARSGGEAPLWNRIILYVEPQWRLADEDLRRLAAQLVPAARGLGLEKLILRVRVAGAGRDLIPLVIHMTSPAKLGMQIGRTGPSLDPIRSLSPYRQAVLRARRRGLTPPYEIIRLLTAPEATHADFPVGRFTEYDLDPRGRLVPVRRGPGSNEAKVVVGEITNLTPTHPEGLTRIVILNDPTKALGALAEPECRRICAAIALAEERMIPVEWFAVSSGATVAMESGVENMDWTAAVLRQIIESTQRGVEINVVTTGINVGAQSYFDAEATMLMHTRGILIMVPEAAMVLTGKDALDASGGISAPDNHGIGGYRPIMGPNGEAQYWAEDLAGACALLFAHYHYTYRAPGESAPRRGSTTDPIDRDVSDFPHTLVSDPDLRTVGDIFSDALNGERKRQFDIRAVMRAVVDDDCRPLERWAGWEDAEAAVVWDCRLGGTSACLIGIESRNLRRHSVPPPDGPQNWTGGTLFPLSSKKVARALRTADGVRPVIILANLSGFDGSPESMRKLQLEYGAEIGRAVAEFRGRLVFCVISRYHGGAFVVFSKALNPAIRVVALEGARASVLGGGPAARVVFAREVVDRVNADPRIVAARGALSPAGPSPQPTLALQRLELQVRSEKQEEIAREFDGIHTIERARTVGAVDDIIRPSELRGYLVRAIGPTPDASADRGGDQ